MNILVISNLYPPYFWGGYELVCADIVDALRKRGHCIKVLTSFRGLKCPKIESEVFRLLKVRFWFEPPFKNRLIEFLWHLWNLFVLRILIKSLKPDVIYAFNLSGLGGLILSWLYTQPLSVVNDIIDTHLIRAYQNDVWFEFCQRSPQSKFKHFIKATIIAFASVFLDTRPSPINLKNSYFRSKFLKRQFQEMDFDVEKAPVIYLGVQLNNFKTPLDYNRGRDIIFIARLCPEKGAHIFLEALSLLRNSSLINNVQVTIIGAVSDKTYGQKLENLRKDLTSSISVQFTGQLMPAETIKLMYKHSIFVFPVLWDEPFGFVLLQVMACGLSIVATCSGGSAELLEDGKNCLVIQKGDVKGLASQLERLLSDSQLRQRLCQQGFETVKKFDFNHSVDLIEEHLSCIKQEAR